LIDPDRRYGSHLKAYHNFFHWLGEGVGLNVHFAEQGRSPHALDAKKVREVTREERAKYLVRIDEHGLLRWAKNDELLDPTIE